MAAPAGDPVPETAEASTAPTTTETSREARWSVRENDLRHSVADAAVFTMGSGGVGTPAAPEEADPATHPGILVAGVYAGDGPAQHLLEGPRWTGIGVDPAPTATAWRLDLYSGVLHREDRDGDFRSLRFACADRPGVLVLRTESAAAQLTPGRPLEDPPVDPEVGVHELPIDSPAPEAPGHGMSKARESGSPHARRVLRVESSCGAIVAAADQWRSGTSRGQRVERIAVAAADPGDRPAAAGVLRDLRRAVETGIDGLLAEQRRAWARRWATVGIDLPDDPEKELAVRFALFQLWTNAGAHGDNAVGARGVSGSGYLGHVFWDTDIYVLPALASMDPDAAEAMIRYRLNRLDPARARARTEGRRGARFPWESAALGVDVTPRAGFLGGTPVPILTGTEEEHITADIAWAVHHFAEWTGRRDYPETTARDLIVETARYWASRVRVDPAGRAHIDRVIGPDEYHETVDDNAYTNVMARWNLRRAAALLPRNPAEAREFEQWRELSHRIVDQLHSDGRYQQFTGYFELEPLTAPALTRQPVAADVLLGRDRVTASQLIKQPDVLMLHHLVPDEVAPGSLIPNLEFYAPRTTHGSSLSPAIMASLLARAGRADEALDMLVPALRLDLDDRTGSTAGGLHMATLGGVWQAMLFGFAGVRVRDGVLSIHPHLPRRWPHLGIAFRCLGRRVRLELTHTGVGITVDGPIEVAAGGHPAVLVSGESWWPARKEPRS
ncbi:glycoside hydrolase family 65 protein [Nocardia sp. 2]|uniref:Glycoside hydrolase family 65 protein n=1 Tax=Nocardia acididurans TaxID=2802282 RepID=A0ABS1M933_9NOCA|nr:glycoside hydrolase family 65 protein [Nocardia acididurans]MBL1077167.1 glycoside hydrolase family 65 protein [Nocardia acididurans]